MRTNLHVPFEERFDASRAGARWDPARKTWFCPDGIDLAGLTKWVPGLSMTKKVKRALKRRRNQT